MEVYLIRHTTPKIEKGICYGQTDLDLTNSFKDEAKKIKDSIFPLNENIVVYSSPLQRCLKLANTLSSSTPILDERLLEMNFGDWEMKSWDSINQQQLTEWMDNFVTTSCPNGESYQLLHQRVINFIDELKRKTNPNVLIVTHGGVIRSFLSHINQTPLEKSFETKVNYGDVFKLSL